MKMKRRALFGGLFSVLVAALVPRLGNSATYLHLDPRWSTDKLRRTMMANGMKYPAPILTRAEALRLASQFGPKFMDAARANYQAPTSIKYLKYRAPAPIKYFNGAGEELTLAEFIESHEPIEGENP